MIHVKKASGGIVPFDPDKLRRSLQRARAGTDEIEAVVNAIRPMLKDGMTTRQLHQLAFANLRRHSSHHAARYRLKWAIMQLGPSGFPFERFVARIMAYEGYVVDVDRIVQGRCVAHEVDVVAEKGGAHYMVECKFHNRPGLVSDVKVPLYIHARFKDIEGPWSALPGHRDKAHHGWVVTNTRFTSDAVQYGTCAGLYLLSWDHPRGNGLRERVDRSGLHPLTCLTTLTAAEKQGYLDRGIVLCSELLAERGEQAKADIPSSRWKKVLAEASVISAHDP